VTERATVPAPDAEWQFVETLDPDGDPKLTLTRAPGATDHGGYRIYSDSYECELDCG